MSESIDEKIEDIDITTFRSELRQTENDSVVNVVQKATNTDQEKVHAVSRLEKSEEDSIDKDLSIEDPIRDTCKRLETLKYSFNGNNAFGTVDFVSDLKTGNSSKSPHQIVIQEKLKISAEDGVYSGVWEVPESGILIVELSNAHSRFTGKTVKWSMDFE